MVFGEQIQYWPKEALKSFDDIAKDINEVKKCNQQARVLRQFFDDKKIIEEKTKKNFSLF